MFTDPVKNLKAFGLREGEIVADLGAGTGFYSILAGQMVPHGKVYAIDISKDFLEVIKNKVKDAHLKNVEIIWGNIEKKGGTGLSDSVVDAVIVSNVFFQIEDKATLIEEIKRILKKHGKVLFIDWSPGKESVLKIKGAVPKDETVRMFEKSGFVLNREINTEMHHYGMIFNKS